MKKVKIFATIGPASDSEDVLRKMILAGMNVARINMSHATSDEIEFRVGTIRKLNEELGTNVGVLIDTKGPEIRTGKFENGGINLEKGMIVTLITNMDELGTTTRFPISYEKLSTSVKIGQHILINDGLVTVEVKEINGTDVVCEVLTDGFIKDRRGINIPGIKLDLPFISEKDRNDILTAIKYDADFVAMSFVSDKEDLIATRELLNANGGENIKVISKVESKLAIENIDDIIELSDAIMVARGDMGVELPYEQVPLIQKELIAKCREAGKVAITATEMMASMENNPRPTRAEISDVANAIIDQTDAIMLSGESAQGKYPVETIEAMTRISKHIEANIDSLSYIYSTVNDDLSIPAVIGYNVAENATKLGSKAIVVSTMSGDTARIVSNFRPSCPIIAMTTDKKVLTALSMAYGVYPVYVEKFVSTDDIIDKAKEVATKEFGFSDGTIIITGDYPTNDTKKTNFMKIELI